jgi:ubiquinone/menaquinone biosynthesis C-methylase UbiE
MDFTHLEPASPHSMEREHRKEEDTYATFVEKYKKSKLIPWRKYIETPSFLKLVGKLTTEDVIDLACGEGFYTRIMRDMTSGRVYGLDFSENMIKLAKWQLKDSDNITFM